MDLKTYFVKSILGDERTCCLDPRRALVGANQHLCAGGSFVHALLPSVFVELMAYVKGVGGIGQRVRLTGRFEFDKDHAAKRDHELVMNCLGCSKDTVTWVLTVIEN